MLKSIAAVRTYLCTSPGQVDDPLGLNFVQEGADLASDWGIVRLIIEPSIAELAAVKCTNEDAAELLECWEVLSHSYDDNTKHYEADTKFHEILANATHNVVIKEAFPPLFRRVSGSSSARLRACTRMKPAACIMKS